MLPSDVCCESEESNNAQKASILELFRVYSNYKYINKACSFFLILKWHLES